MHKYKIKNKMKRNNNNKKRRKKNRSEQKRLCNFISLLGSCCCRPLLHLQFSFISSFHFYNMHAHPRCQFLLLRFFFYSAAAPIPPPAPSACTRSPHLLGFVCCFCVSAAYFNSRATSNFPFRCIDKYFFVRASPCPVSRFPLRIFLFPISISPTLMTYGSACQPAASSTCVRALAFISHISSCLRSPHIPLQF